MGYRPATPAPDQLVVWAPEFGTRFTVFCDVEEEFDWRAPLSRNNRSTYAMAAFPEAHRRFADRGVGLTCMIDHPIATDPAAVAILARVLEDGRSAIGAQLHPWVTPPFDESLTPANSYAGNLPEAVEAAKLDALVAAIEVAFGQRPLAYRAGRYGLGPRTLALLAERGFRLDSSVRAFYDYSADGGPNFSAIGDASYLSGGMVELPFSTVYTGILSRGASKLYPALRGIPLARGVAARLGLINRVSLTPEDMPLGEALVAIDTAIDNGERLLAFSFHSPSLAPGNTPYVRDAADLVRFHAWWSGVFDRLEALGARPATLGEIITAYGANKARSAL